MTYSVHYSDGLELQWTQRKTVYIHVFCSDKANLCRHKNHSKTYQDKTHIRTLQGTGEDYHDTTKWSISTQRLQAHNSPVIDTAGIVQLPTTLDAEGEDNSNPPNLAAPNYTGCPRRNGQNFGRVFLMFNYTDITQNTFIQS